MQRIGNRIEEPRSVRARQAVTKLIERNTDIAHRKIHQQLVRTQRILCLRAATGQIDIGKPPLLLQYMHQLGHAGHQCAGAADLLQFGNFALPCRHEVIQCFLHKRRPIAARPEPSQA